MNRTSGADGGVILTPDQRVRVFVSSTLQELALERAAARDAIAASRFIPVLFELGARPHPPRALYRSYLEQSDVFVGIYWQDYGWIAPRMRVSGLEDEYEFAAGMPRLIYIKQPADAIEQRLADLIRRIGEGGVSYRSFSSPEELAERLRDDLALLVSERFASTTVQRKPRRRVEIPAPASSFVGREAELASVIELLGQPHVRLLTLLGPGGIGKTRLALEATRRAADDFEDGAVFVSLAPVDRPSAVAPAIAEALGTTIESEPAAVELLGAQLRELNFLLVLDNMEHVLAAGLMIAGLLARAPRLTALVTSRSRLDVSGEHVFHVPPLSVPSPGEHEVAAIEHSDAVRLFASRAEAAGWEASQADPAIVAEIVQRLDGLPLAIELAAAQTRLVPAELVRARLEKRLDLGGGPRNAEARHRTLRRTIAWSYDLLDEPVRRFFETLAVFAGGFSIAAAGALAEPEEDVEQLLGALVDASLLTTTPSALSGVRFDMLETIHEFAAERLEERGGRVDVARGHLAYFAELADDAYDAPSGRKALVRLQLDEERENLRAAYWEAMRTAPAEAVRIAGALGVFFSLRGLTRAGYEAIVRALAAAPEASETWRARALTHGGWLAAEQDECDEADRMASEALDLYRSLEDERGVGGSLNTLGYSAMTRDDAEHAIAYFEQAYESFLRTHENYLRLYAAVNLATVLTSRGELATARPLYTEALEYFETGQFADEAATVQFRLAELEETAGNVSAARAYLEKSAALARTTGNRRVLAWVLMRFAAIDAKERRLDEASASFLEALDLHLEVGQPSGFAYCLEYVARAACRECRWTPAARLLGAARARRDAIGMPVPEQEKSELAAVEEDVRAKLGEAAFDLEAAVGASLGHAQLGALVEETFAPIDFAMV